MYEYDEETKSIVIKRKKKRNNCQEVYMATTLNTNSDNTIGEMEIPNSEEEKFIGRGNLGIPLMVRTQVPFSRKVGNVTEPIVALKKNGKNKTTRENKLKLNNFSRRGKEKTLENLKKYEAQENIKNVFELSKARIEAESRYLRVKGKDISIYQKMLSYIIFDDQLKA